MSFSDISHGTGIHANPGVSHDAATAIEIYDNVQRPAEGAEFQQLAAMIDLDMAESTGPGCPCILGHPCDLHGFKDYCRCWATEIAHMLPPFETQVDPAWFSGF